MHPSLTGFTAYRQFIVYKLVPSTRRPGKTDKLPCDYRTGQVVSAHDPQYWTDAATAEATATAWGTEWGVGFVFTESDPFWFLDIDECLQDGKWSPLAIELLTLFTGCAVEVSSSLKSLHIFGSGKPPVHGCKNEPLGLEFYSSGRFVALTGLSAMGNCLADASNILPAFVAKYFPADTSVIDHIGWTSGPAPEWNGPADDAALLMKAMRPSPTSAFTGKASFADLWTGNAEALAKSYPDKSGEGKPYDASSADAALAQHLAFWTGKDCDRIERLMRQSALVRDKWDSHTTYLREFTIQGAVDRQEAVYGDKVPAVVPVAPGAALGPALTVPSGAANEYTPEDFWAHLPSHTYINRRDREFHSVESVNGSLALFKGQLNGKKPSAWLDLYRAVTQMSWQPGYPEIIEGKKSVEGILKDDVKGKIYNLYKPSDAVASDDDPSPWVNHLTYMYPEEAAHIIKWMAFRVQNPGTKINHAIVMGGAQGIGKDWTLEALRYAVGDGNFEDIEYKGLFDNYSEWAERTVLIINEARDTGGIDRYAFYESSKRLIAAPPNTLPCRKMYLGKYYVPNVMAVVITSNNKLNGLYIDPDDRRHFVAWSKIEKPSEEYFAPLWGWMDGPGKPAVMGYLHKLDIADFNPMAPPPRTESWSQIVAANSNPEEGSIADAIDGLQIATLREIIVLLQLKGMNELATNLQKNSRKVPHLLEKVGFEALPNPAAKADGRWRLGDGRKDTLYVDKRLPLNERYLLAQGKTVKT